MKVLVACEFSGRVRDAFIRHGHDAWSCDLLPTETEGNHYQCDIFDVLNNERWDMMIAFPPCEHLTVACGNLWKQKQADGRQQQAIEFFLQLYNAPIDKIAMENPVGILSTVWRKPDQIINPWQFGDPYKKRTCLWLKNLPKLEATNVVEPIGHWISNGSKGKTNHGVCSDPHTRSLTFNGIAEAMATQWGVL